MALNEKSVMIVTDDNVINAQYTKHSSFYFLRFDFYLPIMTNPCVLCIEHLVSKPF